MRRRLGQAKRQPNKPEVYRVSPRLRGRSTSNLLLGRLLVVGPADEGAGLAGVLVDDDQVEVQLAAHVLLADRVVLDAFRLGPVGDVLVEEGPRILGRAVLAVVVHREGEPGAPGVGLGGGNGGDGKRNAGQYHHAPAHRSEFPLSAHRSTGEADAPPSARIRRVVPARADAGVEEEAAVERAALALQLGARIAEGARALIERAGSPVGVDDIGVDVRIVAAAHQAAAHARAALGGPVAAVAGLRRPGLAAVRKRHRSQALAHHHGSAAQRKQREGAAHRHCALVLHDDLYSQSGLSPSTTDGGPQSTAGSNQSPKKGTGGRAAACSRGRLAPFISSRDSDIRRPYLHSLAATTHSRPSRPPAAQRVFTLLTL